MRGFSTKIGDQRFLNFKVLRDGNMEGDYWLLTYFFTDSDTIEVRFLELDPIVRAIEGDDLTGVVIRDKQGKVNRILITAQSAELRTFLKKVGAEVYAKPGSMKRVHGPIE